MTAPRDRVDDVLAHPVLEHRDAQLVARPVDGYSAADAGDPLEGDPARRHIGMQRQPAADRHDPAAESTREPRPERLRAGQEGHDVPAAVRTAVELDVVDLADQ